MGLGPSRAHAADQKDRPNLLWRTSEDNRIFWISCYGGTNGKTPHLDRRAGEGFRYTHCFSNWTKTDYKIGGRPDRDCWDVRDQKKRVGWRGRQLGQPFFAVVNTTSSPEKYKHLGPAEKPGRTVDRLVRFVDMPKTWLRLAGAEIPDTFQGIISASTTRPSCCSPRTMARRLAKGAATPPGVDGPTQPEGGMRMPCIVRWPGRIPAGRTCGELCTMMDLPPTLARLAGGRPDTDKVIDDKDIWDLWSDMPGAQSPHEVFYYYVADQLQAVRDGRWKLHLPLKAIRRKVVNRPLRLVDVSSTPKEVRDFSHKHPEIVRRLTDFAEQARADLGDLDQRGHSQRPARWTGPHPGRS